MEERKMPLEILRAFQEVRGTGLEARLTYVGSRSSSYEWINDEVERASRKGIGFTWVSDASDEDVDRLINESDALVSFGTEGYGIPVLEAIRHCKPVLYGGTQPAAELMVGKGATDCGSPSQESIRQVLSDYSRGSLIAELRSFCQPDAVPTWREFARSVVSATTSAS
jgi:glycosyltransferase involved in cell wall biosynthesis